jgi:hypothetical protein
MGWQLVPDQSPEHGHAPDAAPTPPSDPMIDWCTNSADERYVMERTREDAECAVAVWGRVYEHPTLSWGTRRWREGVEGLGGRYDTLFLP